MTMRLINGADGPIPVVTAWETLPSPFNPEATYLAPSAFDPRFHVNLPGNPAVFDAANPDLAPYRVTPPLLGRVFACADTEAEAVDPQHTIAVRFADETEALAVLAPLGFAVADEPAPGE
jgi:hypothetical protein